MGAFLALFFGGCVLAVIIAKLDMRYPKKDNRKNYPTKTYTTPKDSNNMTILLDEDGHEIWNYDKDLGIK